MNVLQQLPDPVHATSPPVGRQACIPAGVRAGAFLLVGFVAAALLAHAGALDPSGLRRDIPSRPTGLSPVRLLPQQPAPYGSGGYALLATQSDGTPVAFDPCREIHYVVGTGTAPRGGDQLLTEALAAVSLVTGLRFVRDGTSTESPSFERSAYQPERYGDRWAPVLIAWLPSTDPALGAGVLGRAGPSIFGTKGADDQRFVSGLAVFDGPALQNRLDTGQGDLARAVLLHELGHLIGLDHVPDPYQVMYDTNLAPVSSYRDGDRRGLALLGAGRCFTDR